MPEKLSQILAHYTGMPSSEVVRLLGMSQRDIYEDSAYKRMVEQLPSTILYETLPQARAAYERYLPQFAEILAMRYGMKNTPMSAFTLGNWLVGFVEQPTAIINLSKIHSRLPQQAVIEMLPEMIGMLDGMSEGRENWQRALALMALPLAARRE